MGIAGSIVSFVVLWWLILFMTLPIGVETQAEADSVEPGTAPSAPTQPKLIRKMLLTTAITAVLWAGLYAVITFELVTLDDFPF